MSASHAVWQGAGRRIHLQEVGLRDGLQMEAAFVATADKIALCNALSATGMDKGALVTVTTDLHLDLVAGAHRHSGHAVGAPTRLGGGSAPGIPLRVSIHVEGELAAPARLIKVANLHLVEAGRRHIGLMESRANFSGAGFGQAGADPVRGGLVVDVFDFIAVQDREVFRLDAHAAAKRDRLRGPALVQQQPEPPPPLPE